MTKVLTEKERAKLEKSLIETRVKLRRTTEECEKLSKIRWRRTANDKSKNAHVSYETQLKKHNILQERFSYYASKEADILNRLAKDDEARKQAHKPQRYNGSTGSAAPRRSNLKKKRK